MDYSNLLRIKMLKNDGVDNLFYRSKNNSHFFPFFHAYLSFQFKC